MQNEQPNRFAGMELSSSYETAKREWLENDEQSSIGLRIQLKQALDRLQTLHDARLAERILAYKVLQSLSPSLDGRQHEKGYEKASIS